MKGETKMEMDKKIRSAVDYVAEHKDIDGLTVAKNDAANIFADNFDEYMLIWDAFEILIK